MALALVPFNKTLLNIGNGEVDLDTDTFKALLSLTAPIDADEELSDITQIANGNGYTTDGVTLSGVTWTNPSGKQVMFDSADFEWENLGGSPMAEFRYITIYSTANNKLIGRYDFGSGITVPVGSIFRMQPGANGHFRIGPGTIT